MIALSGDRIVGTSTLHLHQGPSRHVGEVRIYLAKEVRGKGLGVRLFQGIIEIAKRRNLYILEARVIRDQVHVVRAFHNVGFTTKCVLEDFYMLPNGDLRDVDFMVMHLRSVDDKF
jgi:phosphinothricin acetyltransferase